MTPALLSYLGPWCCEKGHALGVMVCPDCEVWTSIDRCYRPAENKLNLSASLQSDPYRSTNQE